MLLLNKGLSFEFDVLVAETKETAPEKWQHNNMIRDNKTI
jgi:hypothetical protein